MRYLFPFSHVPKGSRIVLYGANTVGYDFWRQLQTTKYCDIVAWVDRQYKWYRYLNLPVDAPQKITELDYDCILIAVLHGDTYKNILSDLREIGIGDNNIFWRNDYEVSHDIIAKYDNKRVENESTSAKLVSPRNLLRKNLLHITSRVLYAQKYLTGELTNIEIELYEKTISAETAETEDVDEIMVRYFSEYSYKSGLKAYRKAFDNLLDSMKEKGFERKYFLPLDRNNEIINGAHRMASALALGLDVWCYNYDVKIRSHRYDEKYFILHGFTDDDINRMNDVYESFVGR